MSTVNKHGILWRGTQTQSNYIYIFRTRCFKNFLKTFSHPSIIVYDPDSLIVRRGALGGGQTEN